LSKDLRPVFPEERLLIEILIGKPMEFAEKSVWASGGAHYFINGKPLKLSVKEVVKLNPHEIIEKLNEYAAVNKRYCEEYYDFNWVKRFIEANSSRFSLLEFEAQEFIREQAKDALKTDSLFVSFSGGKDSTVVSRLVMDALGRQDIIHIFGDTTLEYPTTEDYLQRLRKEYPTTPFLVARNRDQVFSDLCRKIGPPSRVLRWCCTVFKTGAIKDVIEPCFEDEKTVVAFHGIRHAESVSRSKYERVSISPKITKQRVCQPIIDWLNLDVWLYIISKKLDFNFAYRQGFSRVGCWCCPNNSDWASFLASIYMNKEFCEFQNLLYDFAKTVGKKDWKEYVDSGNWKARQGGNGLELSKNTVVEFKPCATDASSFNFELTKPISESLFDLFIPFGNLDFTIGNARLGEVYVMNRKTGMPLLKLSGKVGKTHLKITVMDDTGIFANKAKTPQLLHAQISKYQTCIGCSACASICRHSAITIENQKIGDVSNDTVVYRINPSLCVGCLECILHFNAGCYMKKVLRVKKDSE
jgi:3''-phosphoadenosine 5''-phosphosulfate sulfotransferase (PAPS reductase)/FAD synthetase and related enzymes